MKTPKELLLQKHRDAESALDGIRERVVGDLARQGRGAAAEPSTSDWLGTLWQELFVSCRGYWMGLGTAWCGILLLIALGAGGLLTGGSGGTEPAVQALQEQLRLRDELLGDARMQEARSGRIEPSTGPRSARRPEVFVV